MLKRIACIALALCLMASAAVAEGVNTSLYQEPLDYTDVVDYSLVKRAQGIAAANGSLYVLTQLSLERWAPGMAEPEVLQDNIKNPDYGYEQPKEGEAAPYVLDCIFALDGQVYAIDTTSGQVYLAVDASGQCVMTPTVTLQGMGKLESDGYTYVPDYYSPCATNGMLYLLMRDYVTGDYNSPDLMRYDLSTGEATKLDVQFAKGLAPYKDGQLLVMISDDQNAWDEDTQQSIPPTLAALDLATGKTAELCQFEQASVFGVTYDPTADMVYYGSGSRIYGLKGLASPAVLCAYLSSQNWGDTVGAVMLDETTYVCMDSNGLSVRTMNRDGLSGGALTIYGEYGSSQHIAFTRLYPEIPVQVSDTYYSDMEDFTNAMVSGDAAMDVLCLNSNYSPLDRLIDKGYAMDLSGYPELTALVDTMYPQFADYVKRDGKLFAVPYSMSTYTFWFNKDTWESIGLSEADYPNTFMELMDFVANWDYDYADDYPDVNIFDDTSLKSTLLNLIFENYVAYYIKLGQPLTFDTDLMRKLMGALEAIDFSAIEPDVTSDADMEDYWNRPSLITCRMGFSGIPTQTDNNYRVLALDEGMEPCLQCDIGVLVVNPRSTRVDQAIKYITTFLDNLDRTGAALTLFPNNNEPVANAGFETYVQRWEQQKADYEAQLKTAAPEDVATIQSYLDDTQYSLDHQDEYRYYVSAEDIALYRETIAPYLVVTGKTALNTWDDSGASEVQTQINQYLDGAITMEQFLKAVDQRLRMMQLEDQ